VKRQLTSATLAVTFVTIACSAMAQEQSRTRSARAVLNSYQENPTLSTTGVGELTLTINDETMTIDYVLTYSGLEGGAATAAHIHVGTRHVNGGVAAFLCGGGDKPACPATEGTVEGTIDPADIIGPAGQGVPAGAFAEFIRLIRLGVTYVNVHTPTWPGGEIRGQIQDLDQRIPQ
jgi:CHRD domain